MRQTNHPGDSVIEQLLAVFRDSRHVIVGMAGEDAVIPGQCDPFDLAQQLFPTKADIGISQYADDPAFPVA